MGTAIILPEWRYSASAEPLGRLLRPLAACAPEALPFDYGRCREYSRGSAERDKYAALTVWGFHSNQVAQ